MESFKYRIGTYIEICDKLTGLKFVILRRFEEELMIISSRLAGLVTLFDAVKKKKEIINLLDKLNKLNAEFGSYIDKLVANIEAGNVGTGESKQHIQSTAYFAGRITLLRSLLLQVLENINDLEQQNQLTDEDKKVLDESKKYDDTINYLG